MTSTPLPPALTITCGPDVNGNAVFALTSSASPGTTIDGTYTITPGGPTSAAFSLDGPSSVAVTGPPGSNLSATYTNPEWHDAHGQLRGDARGPRHADAHQHADTGASAVLASADNGRQGTVQRHQQWAVYRGE
jgi:hypothetical protein